MVYLDAHLDLQQTDPESLAALASCSSVDEVRRFEAPNHFNPLPRYAYGIENFLYAAHELGLIERLIWVSPPHIPRHYSASLIEYVQQMDGISFSELTGFRQLGHNTIRGKLLGLDITICDYDQLAELDIGSDYALDIDIDYFVETPSDRLWIDPEVVVDSILDQLGQPAFATISRAVSSGFTPVYLRYIGDFLYSRLRNSNDLDYYRRLNVSMPDFTRGKIETVIQVCEQLVRDRPDLAAAHYILAQATPESARRDGLVDEACRLDRGYRFDLAREIIGLLHRNRDFDSDTLLELARKVETTDLEPARREEAELALAQLLAKLGKSEQALRLLQRQQGDYADHDEVLLSVCASRMNDIGKRSETRSMLRQVTGRVKNATSALLYLGDIEYAEQNYRGALEHYDAAHDRAPAWMLPLERKLVCYRQLDMQADAERINNELVSRRLKLDNLVRNSG